MRKIEDVFTVERAVAAFAPGKRRVPVQGSWLSGPEQNGSAAGNPVSCCIVTAILLDEAAENTKIGEPTIPYPASACDVARRLDVNAVDLVAVIKGWDARSGEDPTPLGQACWQAVQKARGQGPIS